MVDKVSNTLCLLGDFFSLHGTTFWLEGGTALAAVRDRKVFDWDHDLDIGLWFDDVPDLAELLAFFEERGFRVIVQKNFPFLDNIIQLIPVGPSCDLFFAVDLYLFREVEEFACMRWIHRPVGFSSGLPLRVLNYLKYICNPKTPRSRKISKFVPSFISEFVLKKYLSIYLNFSYCFFHRIPKQFFFDLAVIEFHQTKVSIPSDFDGFLSYRYGPDWRTPDEKFNQNLRWKSVPARVLLPMNLFAEPLWIKKIK